MHTCALQIQPQYSCHAQWTALSLKKGLFFEPLEFSLSPANAVPAVFERLRKWYRESGRVKSLHGAFIDVNPASGDPDFCVLSRRRCHESCRLADELGAEQVIFHSSAFPFLRGAYLESWADRCADFYTELAQTYRAGIRIENSQDVDPAPLRTLMRRIHDAKVSVCLDIGHAHYSRASMEEWFDELGEYITYLHLSDNLGRFDDHLSLGSGNVNWEQVNALWKQLNRSMPATLEVGGISGVEASLEFLQANRYFGIGGNEIEES